MSSSDLDILTSTTAFKMLQMVTSGWYDNSRIGLWIFETLGREWDDMSTWSKDVHYEIFPQTCTWSIATWENLYGIESDETETIEVRRQRLVAKAIYSAPINPEVIRRGVAALTGYETVEIEEHTDPYTFQVTVNHTQHIPNEGEVWMYIYAIKPSHLSFHLLFVMETPVYHEMQAGLLAGQITETNIPEIEIEHIVEERLGLGGLSYTVVEVKVDEIVAQREISKLVKFAGITQSITEKTVPIVNPIHEPETTIHNAVARYTIGEATAEEIKPDHSGRTTVTTGADLTTVQENTTEEIKPFHNNTASVGTGASVSNVQEVISQEIPPTTKNAIEGNVGALVQEVRETTVEELAPTIADFEVHTKNNVHEIVEISIKDKEEDEQ